MQGKTLLELKTVQPTKGEKAVEGYMLRMVQWQDDEGKNIGGPQLHKQILFLNEDGEIRNGKQKGLNSSDWALVKAQFEKIDKIFGEARAKAEVS